MTEFSSPEAVVEEQLQAYNRKDLEAWLATYARDARQYEHPATLLARGHEEIRARAQLRFQEPNLHARLLQRSVMGNVVIDHELISRTFSDGTGTLETVAIYEVQDGKIKSASFITGQKSLD
ncbi:MULTISPECIES: nuclear transport factor 2 family protein [Pseudomonas]|uniref:Nuclear transport factor 2 family protein n=1 Tax=Pseudomonas piscis TaxID=2614538 RepID=A0ABY9NDK3_9PSED|nr:MULTISPECIES: nuclear transport factor 2 family protein [Pseudomonas]AZC20428.1 Steroid delta-isomerase domain protein [Pseudomonas sp. CMR5c]ERO61068.1 steroid delta-isomerase [Pseudomonas piscis]MCU7650655.1 nuclear transport factor 2 family protein [Pseudomonas piscis]WMN16576.1 nuclear transport factor 2 family protein [Pseudomonas piscis]